MDPKLAEIYGTNASVDEADAEKLAAAAMAEGLAEDKSLDLSSLSDEDIEALAASVLAGEEGEEVAELEAAAEESEEETEEVAAEETEKTSADEETQVKVAEADYLGRVMAHAYWQEKSEIEKEAKKKDPGFLAEAGKKLKRFGNKAEKFGRKGTDAAASGAATAGKAVGSAAGKVGKFVGSHGGKSVSKAMGKGMKAVSKGGKAAGRFAMKHRGKGALLGAAGAAGYGAKKLMEKSSSALDTLAEQRALEILAANGFEMNVEETETEKVSAPENQYTILAQAVEARAEAMLSAAGYEFEAEETEE